MEKQETVEQTNEQAAQTDHDKVANSPEFQAGLKKAMAQDNETDTDKSDSVEFVETLESLEYDRNANSKMPLVIPRGAKIYNTQIEFAPVSDDEFLALMEATKQTGERLKKLTIDFYDPLVALGKQKAVNAFGYAEKQGGWRAAVSDADYSQGIIKALDCTARHELEETTELLDYDTPVKMAVFFFRPANNPFQTKLLSRAEPPKPVRKSDFATLKPIQASSGYLKICTARKGAQICPIICGRHPANFTARQVVSFCAF